MKFSLDLKKYIKNLLFALLFVSPIYNLWIFEWGLQVKLPLWVNSIFALISVYVFLIIPKNHRFCFGFFVGLLSFYWIGFSFVFFGFAYLTPLIGIVVASIYMCLIACVLWFENLYLRGVGLLLLGMIHPFGFDWFIIDSFFAYSYFGVQKYAVILVILSMILLRQWVLQKQFDFYFVLAFAFLFGAVDWQSFKAQDSLPFKVKLMQTQFSQDLKWQRENVRQNIALQLSLIQGAILAKYPMIVLPETAFPFVIEGSAYETKLRQMSQDSVLVLGGLRKEKTKLYNSTYVFSQGEMQIFDKVVLAPFGEKVPLPDVLARPLKKIFFNQDLEFVPSQGFGSFTLNQYRFRPVICYEGTSEIAYQKAPKFLIVISNNAWFPYSLEPAWQKNLMKYYSRKYQKILLHSSNGSPSFVIFP